MNSWTLSCSGMPEPFPCQWLCFPSAVPRKLLLFTPKVLQSSAPFCSVGLPSWPIPTEVVVLAHFSPLPCATSRTFVQNAVIQSELKSNWKTPTDLYELWGSPCLHPALKSTSSARCVSFNLQHYRKALCYSECCMARSLSLFSLVAFRRMIWHCLGMPCAATCGEITGGSQPIETCLTYRKHQNMSRICAVVPMVAAFLLRISLNKELLLISEFWSLLILIPSMDYIRHGDSDQFNETCSRKESLFSKCVKWQQGMEVMWKDLDQRKSWIWDDGN